MYSIVGKQNLWAVNSVANKSLAIIRELQSLKQDTDNNLVQISKQDLISLVTGYMFLYNKTLEHKIQPSQKLRKHNIENLH